MGYLSTLGCTKKVIIIITFLLLLFDSHKDQFLVRFSDEGIKNQVVETVFKTNLCLLTVSTLSLTCFSSSFFSSLGILTLMMGFELLMSLSSLWVLRGLSPTDERFSVVLRRLLTIPVVALLLLAVTGWRDSRCLINVSSLVRFSIKSSILRHTN